MLNTDSHREFNFMPYSSIVKQPTSPWNCSNRSSIFDSSIRDVSEDFRIRHYNMRLVTVFWLMHNYQWNAQRLSVSGFAMMYTSMSKQFLVTQWSWLPLLTNAVRHLPLKMHTLRTDSLSNHSVLMVFWEISTLHRKQSSWRMCS